jgi:hypothetical protein
MVVNNELKMIREITVEHNLRYYPGFFLEGLRKAIKTLTGF